MARDDRTDRFRAVFEPEDIFDRFVKNANASTEEPLARDDEPTGLVRREHYAGGPAPEEISEVTEAGAAPGAQREARGGPPSWDHEVTVKAPPDEEPGTRPDAPLPLAMARAFSEPDSDELDLDDEVMTSPRASPLTTDSGQRVLLLTRVKKLTTERGIEPGSDERAPVGGGLRSDESTVPAVEQAALIASTARVEESSPTPLLSPVKESAPTPLGAVVTAESASRLLTPVGSPTLRGSPSWQSVVSPRGEHTQRLEAMKLVPDLEAASSRHGGTYVGEGVEDGQMPTRQLDQILADMAVLLRYGHEEQVRERLEDLRRTYPEDLLLLRRIAEFHVEHEHGPAALETLFALAGGLFERRNVEGMRQVLEQVLLLDPDNARAFRLLGLLEHRDSDAAPD